MFPATAWKGGTNRKGGAGYGLKIAATDRDQFFERSWRKVDLVLPNGKTVTANIAKSSFWNDTCRELINKEIGFWLINEGLAPWPKGFPPKVVLRSIREATFQVSRK